MAFAAPSPEEVPLPKLDVLCGMEDAEEALMNELELKRVQGVLFVMRQCLGISSVQRLGCHGQSRSERNAFFHSEFFLSEFFLSEAEAVAVSAGEVHSLAVNRCGVRCGFRGSGYSVLGLRIGR